MAKISDIEKDISRRQDLTSSKTFTNVKPNSLPDHIKSRVVGFVTINFSEEDILRRVPDSVANAFLGDYLAATDQEMTRVPGPGSDTVILRHKIR